MTRIETRGDHAVRFLNALLNQSEQLISTHTILELGPTQDPIFMKQLQPIFTALELMRIRMQSQ